MISTPIDCDRCGVVYDIEFDDVRIVKANESAQVYVDDAVLELAENRDFGRCPECSAMTPAAYLAGQMADAIEAKGIDWLAAELEYHASQSPDKDVA